MICPRGSGLDSLLWLAVITVSLHGQGLLPGMRGTVGQTEPGDAPRNVCAILRGTSVTAWATCLARSGWLSAPCCPGKEGTHFPSSSFSSWLQGKSPMPRTVCKCQLRFHGLSNSCPREHCSRLSKLTSSPLGGGAGVGGAADCGKDSEGEVQGPVGLEPLP